MLSTPWTAAPIPFAGPGVEVRPYAECAAARPDLSGVAGPVRGTGVPTGGLPTGMAFAPLSQQNLDQIPQNDGTTPGYHSSRRPLS